MALNSSSKQFDVTWNGAKNSIKLISNQPYMSTRTLEQMSYF